MSIKAVIFDFGNVLYRTPDLKEIKKFKRWIEPTGWELIRALIESPGESEYVRDLMTGKVEEDALWELIVQHWNINPRLLSFFRQLGMSKGRLNHELLNIIPKLRTQFKTSILSNAASDARGMYVGIYQMDKIMDDIVISAEVHIAKPDLQIFTVALQRLGIEAHEAIFIDDLKENVEAAKKVGLMSIWHQTNEETMRELRGMLSQEGFVLP
jgi:epoxide hydrolase-like predicted phosphatase